MKQVLQSLKSGEITTPEVPCPGAGRGYALIQSRASLISAGTERMLLEFGKAGWIEKARSQPDKVRQVLEKVRTDGLAATLETVRAKLDQPITLGYSNAGIVVGGDAFAVGTRVVSNGAHAEVVSVPRNLCAVIPDAVSDETAAFTVVGAIALEGVRLAAPTLGECFVVTGLGLIGLLTVQLLRAQGCRVLGLDFDTRKLELAAAFGAETLSLAGGADVVAAAERFSRGRGVDGVLITAATKSNEPVHQAALMSRKRGRIVLVGVAGLELSRDDFYKKELSFQVSCSYGPGRYDAAYEQGGHDYPAAYVRWTEQRNFEAVLDMMAAGRLQVEPLVTHRFAFSEVESAYELIQSERPHLGVVIGYPALAERADGAVLSRTVRLNADAGALTGRAVVGFVGAGGYATKVLMPVFRQAGATLGTVASSGGVSAAHAGRKFGFSEATSDVAAVMGDSRLDTVVIATRHDSHARLVCDGLRAGKNVFVEKPLAMSAEQLSEIEAAYNDACVRFGSARLMVGFNRRFAPHVRKMKALLAAGGGPKSMVVTVNAGRIPGEHWTQDVEIGGGRIVGEACHFVDLLRFLAGSAVTGVSGGRLRDGGSHGDNLTFTLQFADGSLGTVHYFANGDKSFPKERVEVFSDGRILQLDNFRELRAFGWHGFGSMKLWRQDKGAAAMAEAFVGAIRAGAPSPIAFEELLEVARVTLEVAAL